MAKQLSLRQSLPFGQSRRAYSRLSSSFDERFRGTSRGTVARSIPTRSRLKVEGMTIQMDFESISKWEEQLNVNSYLSALQA